LDLRWFLEVSGHAGFLEHAEDFGRDTHPVFLAVIGQDCDSMQIESEGMLTAVFRVGHAMTNMSH
jgi:hypothetical protein